MKKNMTKKDYIFIAQSVIDCHNRKYDISDTINYFLRILGERHDNFDPIKFKQYIYQRTKPDYISEEQAKKWAIKKSLENQ